MKRASLFLLTLTTLLLFLFAAGCTPAGDASRATTGPAVGGAGKLFVDVAAEDYIEVVDLGTHKTVGRITVGRFPHGLVHRRVSLDGQTFDLIFVTVEEAGELVLVDAWSHKEIGRVFVGKVPNELTITRDHRFAYVPLRGEAKVAVVELNLSVANGAAASNPVLLKTHEIGEWPHNSYTGETTGRVYVTSFRSGMIHVFDPATHEMVYEMKFPGEVRPVALTRDETMAYVALSDFQGFVEADMRKREVTRRVELPALPEGTPEPYLKTYVHGTVLSPDEKELWLANCPGSAVYVYSVPELELQAKVEVGKFPHWFAWQPPMADGKTDKWLLWVSEMDSNQVSAIDPDTRKIVATVPTGPQPRRIVVVPPRGD